MAHHEAQNATTETMANVGELKVVYQARRGREILLQKKALILNEQILPMSFVVRFCHAIHWLTCQLQPTWSEYFLQQIPF